MTTESNHGHSPFGGKNIDPLVNGGNANIPTNHVPNLLQLVIQGFVHVDQLLCIIVKDFSFTCQTKLLLAPLYKERFEGPLERAHLLADSRLRDLIYLGGFCEALSLR